MNNSLKKTIAILGTLDTKGEECQFIRECLAESGFSAIMIDSGLLGTPSVKADITRDDVARKAGFHFPELLATGDKGKMIQAMTHGLTSWVHDLFAQGRIQGVIALGGGQGTSMGTAAMQPLPTGFPKVMVTTIASGNMRPFLETQDIAVFPSLTDMFGLNYIFERILANAINALVGMVENYRPIAKGNRLAVGGTAFGVVTTGLMRMRSLFRESGLEMILFHATGVGGLTMESMTQSGYFDAVVDWTTHEIVDEVGKGIFRSGKSRLDVLSRINLPYVIAPGAIDYIVQGAWTELPPSWKKRKHIVHNRNITLVRATGKEMAKAAEFMARKVNLAVCPVKILIPLRGFSEPNAKGKLFYDPEADMMFINTLKHRLKDTSSIVETDAHINDEAFVRSGFTEIMKMLGRQNRIGLL